MNYATKQVVVYVYNVKGGIDIIGAWRKGGNLSVPPKIYGFFKNDNSIIVVSWSPPEDNGGWPITGYSIYRSIDGSDMVMVANLSADVTSWTDVLPSQNRDKEHTYTYRVSAWNAIGESNLSAPVSIVVPAKEKSRNSENSAMIPSLAPGAVVASMAIAVAVWRRKKRRK